MIKPTLKPNIVVQDNGKIRISVSGTGKRLSQKALTGKQRLKINNPINHKSFVLRQRTTKNGRMGQIKGRYKVKK